MPRNRKGLKSDLKELLMLLILKFEGPVGRYRLKGMLGLSEHEGRVKRMLADLRRGSYASSGRSGSKITAKGEALLKRHLNMYGIKDVKDLKLQPLETGPASFVIHLRGKANAVTSGIRERDAAIRGGALGAVVLTFKNGVLSVPTVYPDLSSVYPELVEEICKSFSLADGDVLIIASAENKWRALEGGLAAARALA